MNMHTFHATLERRGRLVSAIERTCCQLHCHGEQRISPSELAGKLNVSPDDPDFRVALRVAREHCIVHLLTY